MSTISSSKSTHLQSGCETTLFERACIYGLTLLIPDIYTVTSNQHPLYQRLCSAYSHWNPQLTPHLFRSCLRLNSGIPTSQLTMAAWFQRYPSHKTTSLNLVPSNKFWSAMATQFSPASNFQRCRKHPPILAFSSTVRRHLPISLLKWLVATAPQAPHPNPARKTSYC